VRMGLSGNILETIIPVDLHLSSAYKDGQHKSITTLVRPRRRMAEAQINNSLLFVLPNGRYTLTPNIMATNGGGLKLSCGISHRISLRMR